MFKSFSLFPPVIRNFMQILLTNIIQPVSALGKAESFPVLMPSVNEAVSTKPGRTGVFLLLATLTMDAISPNSSPRIQCQERAGLLSSFPPSLGCTSHHQGHILSKTYLSLFTQCQSFPAPKLQRIPQLNPDPVRKQPKKPHCASRPSTPIALASK